MSCRQKSRWGSVRTRAGQFTYLLTSDQGRSTKAPNTRADADSSPLLASALSVPSSTPSSPRASLPAWVASCTRRRVLLPGAASAARSRAANDAPCLSESNTSTRRGSACGSEPSSPRFSACPFVRTSGSACRKASTSNAAERTSCAALARCSRTSWRCRHLSVCPGW